jgi:hypothetical protein
MNGAHHNLSEGALMKTTEFLRQSKRKFGQLSKRMTTKCEFTALLLNTDMRILSNVYVVTRQITCGFWIYWIF